MKYLARCLVGGTQQSQDFNQAPTIPSLLGWYRSWVSLGGALASGSGKAWEEDGLVRKPRGAGRPAPAPGRPGH